ncbi:MAG: hypothetical protein JW956_12450 [Calditrichaceae bacterium]|nr:hypothetical protein [Calditrichaceae bacterium]
MTFKKKILEHLLSAFLITSLLGTLLYFTIEKKNIEKIQSNEKIESYLGLSFIDFENPFDRALLLDVLNAYEPDQTSEHETLIRTIEQYRKSSLIAGMEEAYRKEPLSSKKWQQLSLMYAKFILIYMFVMLLTYYGVQTFGILRFVRRQQNQKSHLLCFLQQLFSAPKFSRIKDYLKYYLQAILHLIKAVIIASSYFVLFAPAYVIAYSLKTQLNTDTIFFMITLAVISNGLLITYTNKFYTFLVAESRKGYVQTAIVKNLNTSYKQTDKSGISYASVFSFRKHFPMHVFQHIFLNARYQYLQTIKEQASFLISGLIIIEMALNIQGHFSYELLKQLLYKNYDIVIVIILGIFYMVKLTEIFTDWLTHKKSLKYENIEPVCAK